MVIEASESLCKRLIRHDDAPEHGACEVAGHALHVDDIPGPAAHSMGVVATPELPEARLLIRASPYLIKFVDDEHDIGQSQDGEGIVEHQECRLGPVPFAPEGLVSDADAELRRAMAVIDVVQRRGADWPPRCPVIDDKGYIAPVRDDACVRARQLFQAQSQPWGGGRPRVPEVVGPAQVERDQVAPERPQAHPLPVDIHDRLLATPLCHGLRVIRRRTHAAHPRRAVSSLPFS